MKNVALKTKPMTNEIRPIKTLLLLAFLIVFAAPAYFIPKSLAYALVALAFITYFASSRVSHSPYLFAATILTIYLGFAIDLTLLFYLFPIALAAITETFRIERKKVKALFTICTFSIIVQIFAINLETIGTGSRLGLGTDPNFSAFWIFLVCVVGFSIRSNLTILLLIITAYLTQSRLFILMSALYFFLYFFQNSDKVQKIAALTRRNPVIVFFLINSCFLLSQGVVFSYFFSDRFLEASEGLSRVINIADTSNLGRISANIHWTSEIVENFKQYISTTRNASEIKNVEIGILTPHNSFLFSIITGSISSTLIYLLIFKSILKDSKTTEPAFLYLTYLIGSLFLHGFYSPIFILGFIFVKWACNNPPNDPNH